MSSRSFVVWFYLIFLCCSCSTQPDTKTTETTDVWLNPALFDNTLWPYDDFYGFVNGTWLSKAVVPHGKNSWNSFDELNEKNLAFLHHELVNAIDSNRYSFGSDQRKAAEFFAVGMDSVRAEELDATPLAVELARIGAIKTRSDLQNYVAFHQMIGEDIFFGLNTLPDVDDPTKIVLHLTPGVLGLSRTDDYLKSDARSFQVREKYRDYISRLLTMSDQEDGASKKNADRVLAFETQLARANGAARNSPTKTAVRQLMEVYGGIDWLSYLNSIGIKTDSVIVESSDRLKATNKIFETLPLDDLKLYLQWSLLRESAPFLSHRFVKASAEFNAWYVDGNVSVQPRWARILRYTNSYFGEGLGKLFSKAHLSAAAEMRVNDLARNVKLAYATRIKELKEVPDSTKRIWLERLGALKINVRNVQGSKRYAGLVVETGQKVSFFENVIRARQFHVQQMLARLGKPTDPSQWYEPTQTVKLVYSDLSNELMIPVGILQIPFFDDRYDEAVNYGALGSVIAREMINAMQEQMVSKGVSPSEQKTRVKTSNIDFVNEFLGYAAANKSKDRLSPEIADHLAAVSIAFDGLQRHFVENPEPDSTKGMTPRQRFFLSWATSCREKARAVQAQDDKETISRKAEVNRILGSFDKFYEAFDVKPGRGMYVEPNERTKIW